MHQVPPLPYAYNALLPWIDEETMRLHHDKHHQAYVDKLNVALEKFPELQNLKLEKLLSDLESVPEEIRLAVRNHGGGHWNHSFFWQMMMPPMDKSTISDEVNEILSEAFGSFDKFKEEFTAVAGGLFGSGWVWLVMSSNHSLKIVTTPNQDNPLALGQKPILGLDVWEHAYYLKYQNRRTEYAQAFFEVVNWPKVASLLTDKS